MSMRIRSGAIGSIAASLISAAILLVAASLASLSGASADTSADPSATPTDTATATATATPTDTTTATPVTPTETTTPEPTPTPGWGTQEFTLPDGRTYFARIPTCAPATAAECRTWLATPHQAIVFAHGFGGGETMDIAKATLDAWASFRKQADTIFIFAVSKDGTRAFNGGICCTFNAVDDVSYVVNTVSDLATHAAVNTSRVGIIGASNGGMLALKSACERPDVFDAGSSWAGSFPGPCGKAGVRISQYHGGADTYIPARGGTTYVNGHWFTVPPAVDLGSTMATGNVFPLTIVPGVGHTPTYPILIAQLAWVAGNLR